MSTTPTPEADRPDLPPAHVHNIGPVIACLPVAGTRSLAVGQSTYVVVCWRDRVPDSRAYSVHTTRRDTRAGYPTFGAWIQDGSGDYDHTLLWALAAMIRKAGYPLD